MVIKKRELLVSVFESTVFFRWIQFSISFQRNSTVESHVFCDDFDKIQNYWIYPYTNTYIIIYVRQETLHALFQFFGGAGTVLVLVPVRVEIPRSTVQR